MSENNKSTPVGGYLAAFAIGALAGAGIALLYAPQSGEETRKMLAKRANNMKKAAADAIDDVKESIHGKQAEIAAALEAGREAMQKERSRH